MSGAGSSPADGAVQVPTPPPCSLAIHRAGSAVVVAIDGELHGDTARGLDHVLRDLICDQGNLHVVVDVGAVLHADPSGVGALIDACRLAQEHHATLALVNVLPAVEQALDGCSSDGDVTVEGVEAECSRPIRGTRDGERLDDARRGFGQCTDDHVVEFYVGEDHLAESVGEFLVPALDRGEAALVVATEGHRRRCDEVLGALGVDVADCRRQERYVALDADETLARFMVGDVPDGTRFEAAVGELVRCKGASFGGIRIFGEMVALLWGRGNVGAAAALEDLWNSLRAKETFELLCAYPTSLFGHDDATEPFRRICDQHTRVVPSERIAVEQGALRAIALLEQRVDAASTARRALEKRNHELEQHLARIGPGS